MHDKNFLIYSWSAYSHDVVGTLHCIYAKDLAVCCLFLLYFRMTFFQNVEKTTAID